MSRTAKADERTVGDQRLIRSRNHDQHKGGADCKTALAGFVASDGSIAAPVEVHLITARRR